MEIMIIIPCFNDNKQLDALLKSPFIINKLEVLVVDDGSCTPVSIDDSYKNIKLIRNEVNRGKGYSIRKGLSYALKNNYTHAITMDADLQHDPSYIDKFIDIDQNVNVVIGARKFDSEMPLHRRISNTITSTIVSILAGKKILDSQSGYRRYLLKNSSFQHCIEDGFQFESEFLINELRNESSNIEHVFIPTLYNNEKSSINNIVDTYKFIKLIIRKIIGR